MTKKKVLLLMLAMVMVVSLLAGCGSPDAEPEEEPEPDTPNGEEVVEEPAAEELEEIDIDIVVGFGAGGSNDLSARYLAEAMHAHGINANVVNMPGGMGTEAAYHVSTQAPDSHMFMWAHPLIMSFEPAAGDRGYTIHDFDPAGLVASPTFALASKADAPWDDMDSLIEYIQENPGEVVLGGQGEGNMMHFIAELILDPDELDYSYVGFGGGADVALNLTGGHVDLGHLSLAAARPLHEDGDLTVLVNTQILIDRDPLMPDIPNIDEFGIDAREPHPLGLWAPTGAPQELIDRVSSAVEEIAQDEEFIQNYQDIGVVAHYLNPQEQWDFFMEVEDDMIPRFVEWLEAFDG
ncbi:MAG: tripartite tricarboxylate transporter substrate binding protein [Tindallia sp. MSAO_Bac2]|nr:MAG: tripartite tricarboxylate transporter substrate binding protein [Tindallia sp. MSAO_Bac2]